MAFARNVVLQMQLRLIEKKEPEQLIIYGAFNVIIVNRVALKNASL